MADGGTNVGRLQPESARDNLQVYLREMGSVPLLTRKAEIVLARKMERGMRRLIGSLAQCSVVEEELRLLDEQIRQRSLSPECYFECEGALSERRLRAVRVAIKRIQASLAEANKLEIRLQRLKPGGRARQRLAWAVARRRKIVFWIESTAACDMTTARAPIAPAAFTSSDSRAFLKPVLIR